MRKPAMKFENLVVCCAYGLPFVADISPIGNLLYSDS
jgi:hypothetical protein